jgi:tRNA (cmo5U34)-methyltransferase
MPCVQERADRGAVVLYKGDKQMSEDFKRSNWSRPEFSMEFRDNADIYVIERQRLLGIMRSFFRHHFRGRENPSVLDLGCGDGIVAREILSVDKTIKATLVDASEDMLSVASKKLKGIENVKYIKVSFQEMLHKDILKEDFDFVVSSLAIHHLTMSEKKGLFRLIHSHLKDGGYFMNIDILLAPTELLDGWYMRLWQEWIEEQKTLHGIEREYYYDVVRRYKDNRDNKPDTLDEQLHALRGTGFKEVDCYYKYGVFAIYGGRR